MFSHKKFGMKYKFEIIKIIAKHNNVCYIIILKFNNRII